MGFLIKGLIVGLSIAAPIGPIGLLCIRRSLAEGRVSGLLSGLGGRLRSKFSGCGCKSSCGSCGGCGSSCGGCGSSCGCN